jgi:hypothetical protein
MKNQKKKKKARKKIKRTYCRVNGPAQHRAHAGGAEFHPANERSIGIPGKISGGNRDTAEVTQNCDLEFLENL